MSKKKHNISYIKPEEPQFLRELKIQAGYKEGPTVDTKRENDDSDFEEDHIDEQPQVVVLNSGDLTAEEADEYQLKKDEEEAQVPADLTKRVIFNKSAKLIETKVKSDSDVEPKKKRRKSNQPCKSLLSFNEEEEEEQQL